MKPLKATLKITFASRADATWLMENDGNRHLHAELIAKKIDQDEYIIAKIDNKPVGYLRLSYFWSFIPYIDIIAVDEPYQRQGIGRAMLSFLENYARRNGQQLILSSSQANEPDPQAWHRHLGFKDAGALVLLSPIQDVSEIIFVKQL